MSLSLSYLSSSLPIHYHHQYHHYCSIIIRDLLSNFSLHFPSTFKSNDHRIRLKPSHIRSSGPSPSSPEPAQITLQRRPRENRASRVGRRGRRRGTHATWQVCTFCPSFTRERRGKKQSWRTYCRTAIPVFLSLSWELHLSTTIHMTHLRDAHCNDVYTVKGIWRLRQLLLSSVRCERNHS